MSKSWEIPILWGKTEKHIYRHRVIWFIKKIIRMGKIWNLLDLVVLLQENSHLHVSRKLHLEKMVENGLKAEDLKGCGWNRKAVLLLLKIIWIPTHKLPTKSDMKFKSQNKKVSFGDAGETWSIKSLLLEITELKRVKEQQWSKIIHHCDP